MPPDPRDYHQSVPFAELHGWTLEPPPTPSLGHRLRAAWKALRGHPVIFHAGLLAGTPIHLRHMDHGYIACNIFRCPSDGAEIGVYVNGKAGGGLPNWIFSPGEEGHE